LTVSARVPTRQAGLRWSPELIAYAIDLWHRKHLRLPTTDEWERAGENHPARKTVQRVCGSWSRAMEIAGFVPGRPGANMRWEVRANPWKHGAS
jgi:hypothetical protein